MSWIHRLSRTEVEEAGELADRASADELEAQSIKYGKIDHWFRWRIVPCSILPAYVVILLREMRVIATAETSAWMALLGLAFMLCVVLTAREIWYRWCVIELALLLRRKRDERNAA